MFTWRDGDLDEEQEEAVRSDGNTFLIACPGSGKTRTLTYKIAYELSRLESKKSRVVAITYTHRAADENHERIASLGVDTSQLWIGTIHSFCLEWILKPYGIYHERLRDGFRIINTHDSQEIFEELCEPYQGSKITYWDCGYYFVEGGHVLCCSQEAKHDALNAILAAYFERLTRARQIDFEWMLRCSLEILRQNEKIRTVLSGVFSMILVDEYQDTKAIQYSIICSILKAGGGKTRAFIVGDPNQSIFESLGGSPMPVAECSALSGFAFEERELWKNYRSSARIVEYFGNYNVHQTRIESSSEHKEYSSLVTFNTNVVRADLEQEIVRLIWHNVIELAISPNEICVLAPWWISLSGMTRRLIELLPEFEFNGPGTVPFARDLDNFFYKLSQIALTSASPEFYSRRHRWAADIIQELHSAGLTVESLNCKKLLRRCNAIHIAETDGLAYLRIFFEELFQALGVDFASVPMLQEHHASFFASSAARIAEAVKKGAAFMSDISAFRKVFAPRRGVTVSTIHGIKGDEYDAVIAYALLEGMVPHFSDANGATSARKLLYVISSRARKNLHLISERGRSRGRSREYEPTEVLRQCQFGYDLLPWE